MLYEDTEHMFGCMVGKIENGTDGRWARQQILDHQHYSVYPCSPSHPRSLDLFVRPFTRRIFVQFEYVLHLCTTSVFLKTATAIWIKSYNSSMSLVLLLCFGHRNAHTERPSWNGTHSHSQKIWSMNLTRTNQPDIFPNAPDNICM